MPRGIPKKKSNIITKKDLLDIDDESMLLKDINSEESSNSGIEPASIEENLHKGLRGVAPVDTDLDDIVSKAKLEKQQPKKGRKSWRPPSDLDAELKDKNADYGLRWIRNTKGQDNRVRDAQKEGYEFVYPNELVGGEHEGKLAGTGLDYPVQSNEMVLMKLHNETNRERTEHYQKKVMDTQKDQAALARDMASLGAESIYDTKGRI